MHNYGISKVQNKRGLAEEMRRFGEDRKILMARAFPKDILPAKKRFLFISTRKEVLFCQSRMKEKCFRQAYLKGTGLRI